MTTTDKGDALKVFVRVGPYNVNPETAIDKASVISHEYGHSLGLPDFYSTGSRETYGDWNLMATDKSQNMDAYSRQELGWVVPEVLRGRRDPDRHGVQRLQGGHRRHPLAAAGRHAVHPHRRPRRDRAQLARCTSRSSRAASSSTRRSSTPATRPPRPTPGGRGSGNDFGCATDGGGPQPRLLRPRAWPRCPRAATGQLTFKSMLDIEWDYDYGFVLTSTDGGKTYTSHASSTVQRPTTDPLAGNPNQNGCQATYDNGITGTARSYAGRSPCSSTARRRRTPDAVFVAD